MTDIEKNCETCTWFRQAPGSGVCGHPKAYSDMKEYTNFTCTCDKWEFLDFKNMSKEDRIKKGYRYDKIEKGWRSPEP